MSREKFLRRGLFTAVGFLILLVGLDFFYATSYWEVQTNLALMKVNGVSIPATGASFRFDIDAATYGAPDVIADLGLLRHTDLTGNEIEPAQYAGTPRQIELPAADGGTDVWIFDYHCYTFDLTVRTDADVEVYEAIHELRYLWALANPGVPAFLCPWNLVQSHKITRGEIATYIFTGDGLDWSGYKGLPAQFEVWANFAFKPHQYRFENNASFTGLWAGVMSASVLAVQGDKYGDQEASSGTPWKYVVDQHQGTALDIYTAVDGTKIPQITFAGANPDSTIPNAVALKVSGKLWAGGYAPQDNIYSAIAINVWVTVTVRLDVLISHSYHFDPGESPPDVNAGTGEESGFKEFIPDLSGLVLLLLAVTGIIAAVIVLLIVVIKVLK